MAGTIGIDSARFGTAELEAADGMTVLDVNGERVSVYRDEFGVPHIFAETNRGAFEAYGYAVAEDRLWQLEVNRRAAQGRLAEIFGASQVVSDSNTRTLGYTPAELDAQWAQASAEEQDVYTAYVNGINRYITDVVAHDPMNKLPFEFHYLGLDVPVAWTTRDAVAYAVLQARLFFERGDTERDNQTLLARLTAMHGAAAAQGIFNDVQWINDPEAAASVPATGANGPRQHPTPGKGQLDGVGEATEALGDPTAALNAVGIASSLGSNGWVVSAARSAEQAAMLVGGPQLTINTPDIAHEVQIKVGSEMNVRGFAFAGLPFVLIGRNNRLSWTMMTAPTNTVDTYVEAPCDNGAPGYLYNGVCTVYERRTETILVRDAAPTTITVERSIHGPVTATVGTTKFTRKARQRNREFETFRAFFAIDKADSIESFESALHRFVGAINVLYADLVGNIAYFRPGETPVRPAGFDIRLPLPGTGSAEWSGELLPMPRAINPARGWLANWNNKAAVDEDIDSTVAGKQHGVREIEMRLEGTGRLSLQDMRDVVKDISRTPLNGAGRNSRYVKPYLLAALDAVPSLHPLAAQARAVLEAWDGSLYGDIGSTTQHPGAVIFTTWITSMRAAIYADELGANARLATVNVLTHCLDYFFTGTTGVPPSRDYFNGVHPYVKLSEAFTDALNRLGPDPAAWSSRPRDVTQFRHTLFPTVPEVASIFETNKGTYVQIVVHRAPKLTSENIHILGQSGFIRQQGVTPVFDAHYSDQLEMYRTFRYKPMILYKNPQLQY